MAGEVLAAGTRLPWSQGGRLPRFPGDPCLAEMRSKKLEEKRTSVQALGCPGSGLVCGAGKSSQDHGAVNFPPRVLPAG